MGERAFTGTKKLALEGNHAERSAERPPPRTMEWRWGGVLELPAPGMQNPGKPRERCPEETLVFGEPFECLGRGVEQSVVREALLRADKRA